MKLLIKHFNELTTRELFLIYKLRVSVFVVEQNCPYQEVDDLDLNAYHILLMEENNIVAYARVYMEKGVAHIGRVIAVKRRCGYATKIVKKAIHVSKEKLKVDRIYLEAQVYAKSLYEKVGFVCVSEEFLIDNIPHIGMELSL